MISMGLSTIMNIEYKVTGFIVYILDYLCTVLGMTGYIRPYTIPMVRVDRRCLELMVIGSGQLMVHQVVLSEHHPVLPGVPGDLGSVLVVLVVQVALVVMMTVVAVVSFIQVLKVVLIMMTTMMILINSVNEVQDQNHLVVF
jgi:hypothetical protein